MTNFAKVLHRPEEKRVNVNGVELCYFEWAGSGPTVLFTHGTGFHARTWDAVIAELGDVHAISLEHRGHGRSERKEPYHWGTIGDDAIAFVEALDLSNVVGAGFSMGGHILVQAMGRHLHRFKGAVLIDPIIFSPEDILRLTAREKPHHAARRRNHWPSPQAFYDRLKDTVPFNAWKEEALRDYCEYGLLPLPAGGFELACPPTVEGAIYDNNFRTDVSAVLKTLDVPITVIRAGIRPQSTDNRPKPFWAGLAEYLPQAEDVLMDNCTHTIPMEDPSAVARYIQAMRAR